MPNIIFVTAAGEEHSVIAHSGETLMEAARHHNIPGILADCGGACACATCHVYIENPRGVALESVTSLENDMLEFCESERRPTSRLSCQIVVADDLEGLRVHVAQD